MTSSKSPFATSLILPAVIMSKWKGVEARLTRRKELHVATNVN